MTSNHSLIDLVKRRAKRIRKSLGIPHHSALDEACKEHGYSNYKHLLNSQNALAISNPIIVPKLIGPNNFNPVIGEGRYKRPRAKLSIETHRSMGNLLKEVIQRTTMRKTVTNPLNKVRCILDNWVAAEYPSDKELSNDVFFDLYYHEDDISLLKTISAAECDALTQKLEELKSLLISNYPSCKPLADLLKHVESASESLDKWADSNKKNLPKNLQTVSKNKNARIPFGTIVRLKPRNNEYAVVLDNNGAVLVYGKAGEGYYGREEVTISRSQAVRQVDPLRLYLPYGMWTCENGTKVLYNRDYCPIWVKYTNGKVEGIEPERWVAYKEQVWFFSDNTAPWNDKNQLIKCKEILVEWGVENKLPQSLKRFLTFVEKGYGWFKIEKNRSDVFQG